MDNPKRDERQQVEREDRPKIDRRRVLFTEKDLFKAAGSDPSTNKHAFDLLQSLRCHYGYPYSVDPKPLAGSSENMIALAQDPLAHRNPVGTAKWVILELTAEHKSTTHRNQRRFWRHDEGPTSNIYDRWTNKGRLGTLRGLNLAIIHLKDLSQEDRAIITMAIRLLTIDMERTRAIYALLAVPGTIQNAKGKVVYSGPVVRSACLRGYPRYVYNPASTSSAAGLLGHYDYRRRMDPLEFAIIELCEGLIPNHDQYLGLWQLGQQWNEPLLRANLAGLRTMYPYEIRVYEDGTKASMLLGPKSNSSTAELRVVISGLNDQFESMTPQLKDRAVPPSDARIVTEDQGWEVVESWLFKSPDRVRAIALPRKKVKIRARFEPDADPDIRVFR